jgi:excisionase family DNA binding protein
MDSRSQGRPRDARKGSAGHPVGRTMTLIEAGAILGLAPANLRQQIKKGKLAATKMGRDWFVTRAEVDRYMRENRRVR